MLLIPDFRNMRLHALSEVPSIRLQESAGMNPDRSCKARMTEGFGILHRVRKNKEIINYKTERKGRTQDK